MDTKVRDVMTPGPIGVDYYQSIGEAARTMRDWGAVRRLPVIENGQVAGMVSLGDLAMHDPAMHDPASALAAVAGARASR